MLNKIKKALLNPIRTIDFILAKYAIWLPDKLYLSIRYRLLTGKSMNWGNPQTFNEKLQWLKLHDHNPAYTQMVDKYEVKQYVEKIVGGGYTIPTLGVWNSFEEIDFDSLPNRFVLKATHDSGTVIICKDKTLFDYKAAKKLFKKRLRQNYYDSHREFPYKNIRPRIIAEEYLTEDSNDTIVYANRNIQERFGLLDYKFMCFNGKVRALFLDIGVVNPNGNGHASEYYRSIFNRDFQKLPVCETRSHYPRLIEKPACWDEMIWIAEKLSQGIPHLRVDMYCINGAIKIGELTFYHGSGWSNQFKPEAWDLIFGDWINLSQVKKMPR